MDIDLQGYLTLAAMPLAMIGFGVFTWRTRTFSRRDPDMRQSRINRLEHATEVVPENYIHLDGYCQDCFKRRQQYFNQPPAPR